jgi:hypothetical protein
VEKHRQWRCCTGAVLAGSNMTLEKTKVKRGNKLSKKEKKKDWKR